MARILLAEDDQPLGLSIKKLLEEEQDHHVQLVFDGDMAVWAAKKYTFDLVISDAAMPVLSGLELLQKLREDPKTAEIPFILHTMSEEDLFEGLFDGLNAFYVKKRSGDLLQKVTELLAVKA